jgi:hypothetical protein
MKYLFSICIILAGIFCAAQEPELASKGVRYGAGSSTEGAIPVNELEKKITNNRFEGKIKGKVIEVCQEKGCWMKMERENGEKLMVKFKDYGFFMPKNIVGKDVILDGEATINEVSVKQQRHYAQDAGKSKEEIEKIKEPKKELQFVARGVLVL